MTASEFKQRYLPLHRGFFQTAFRLMGNRQDAEDMVQETYLKLWSLRDSIPCLDYRGYCTTVLRRVCIDHLRQRHQEQGIEPAILKGDGYTEHLIETRQQAAVVMSAIDKLPQQQQLAIILHDVKGFSCSEIEEQAGLKESTVRVLLSRARKRIRELIRERV